MPPRGKPLKYQFKDQWAFQDQFVMVTEGDAVVTAVLDLNDILGVLRESGVLWLENNSGWRDQLETDTGAEPPTRWNDRFSMSLMATP